MSNEETRRDFLRLMGLGGVVFASGLAGCGGASSAAGGARGGSRREDFFFLQLSDTHWGFKGPANPEADTTLEKTVATIKATGRTPDFIVFTGDLTHTTDDPALRRARMTEFKKIVAELGPMTLKFMPGEHDASLDRGEAYREHFGETHYVFDHKGIHFVALDNVSDPKGALGDAQLAWLEADLRQLPRDAPIVVFAHRPLFDLYPAWDWATLDGARAVEVLSRYDNVTVFYGHIHQEHHHTTGRIAHHSARSLVFPLPAPGSAPKRAPLPWDPASPTHGIGYRSVEGRGGRLPPRGAARRPASRCGRGSERGRREDHGEAVRVLSAHREASPRPARRPRAHGARSRAWLQRPRLRPARRAHARKAGAAPGRPRQGRALPVPLRRLLWRRARGNERLDRRLGLRSAASAW
jgi:hypothetical protein